MFKRLTTVFFVSLLLSNFSMGQLSLEIEKDPGGKGIDDGVATVTVTGGSGNYDYYWTNSGTSRDSSTARGLREGKDYTITVTDKETGDKESVTFAISSQNFNEQINSTFNPVVDAIGWVLMADPFAKFGIYDPTVYAEKAKVQIPGFDDEDIDKIKIEKWLVKEGDRVFPGDVLGKVVIDGVKETELVSPDTGAVEFLYDEGEVISAKEMKASRFNKDADIAAYVNYDSPKPLLSANGDSKSISIPLIVVWLVLGAIFFTIKMRFINFRGVKHALDLVRGKYDDPEDKGEVSHFQALTTALSGTVGLGNIAGVAVAITMGGPGATFWMILAGLLGMASKFVECTLGVKYREIDEDGTVYGGPMYYLSKGLKKKNLAGLGKLLAFLFAILCIGGSLGGGNMFQANQAFAQLQGTFPGLEGMGPYFGILMAILVGIVIIGGIKSIAKVTDKIVPFMVGIYVLFAILIIFFNINNIGAAFSTIYNGAFSPDALKGGVIGVLILGFQRAAFSNEAGVGSASIAHSAAKTKEHVSEGIVALMEPFIDTVVVCTMTALVLIFTGYAESPGGLEGAELTSAAFGERFPWFSHVLTLAIVLFAFSTMISWSYYGVNAVQYLLGRNRWVEYGYKFVFCLFVIVGASSSLGAVIDFSDFMVLGMAFPNILGLVILSGEVRRDLKDYFSRIKSGAIKRFK